LMYHFYADIFLTNLETCFFFLLDDINLLALMNKMIKNKHLFQHFFLI